ncbi:precorrin-6A synthase (deacetylating) [Nocardioides sp. CFH 31398]|uniref:precorrin-6A synthase (deacetylating) n=1 Tax=Nocardioides sp. CFH 31398 TaxID=2919579 RepID=UPI001F05E1DE|nr:precorrin-6A synthase (deacetylating) [Nocardioides sp. CFH 31398]MCH1865527.1 precorrin-6A synthase (deacetylating) [Nocardioides sp. CFH 31398]
MTTTIRVVGMGMGPDHLTPAAARALAASSYVVAPRKHRPGGQGDQLLAVRAEVCRTFGLELVEVVDPPRSGEGDYRGSVAEWHAARLARWEEAVAARAGDPAWLVWGDPSLYDSHVRILGELARRRGAALQVEPGVAAPSLLAARHGVVLHAIGEPVLVTTGRRLERDLVGQSAVVVMLDGDLTCLAPPVLTRLDGWSIWWGANLQTSSERLVSGRLPAVAEDLRSARDEVRRRAGWVLDTYLVRSPSSTG